MLNREKYSAFLLIILPVLAIALWAFSVNTARINITNGIGELGLITILPLEFFVSLSMLSAAFIIALTMRQKKSFIIACQIILLILFLYATPALVEGTARATASYYNYRPIDYIIQNGNLNPVVSWNHDWPSFDIFFSTLTQITGFSNQITLTSYSIFYNIILFFALFLLFNLLFNGQKEKWLAIWIFYIANWVGQDYFSMQSLGFLILILLLFLLFKFFESKTRPRSLLLIMILLFAMSVITHLLTSIVLLSILIVFFISGNFRRSNLVIIFIVIIVAWNAFDAITFFQTNLLPKVSGMLNIGSIFQSGLVDRLGGSATHSIVSTVRVVFTALIGLFAFLGFASRWRQFKKGSLDRKVFLILVGVLPILFLFSYGGEIFMRFWFLSIVPLSFFIALGSRHKMFFGALAIFLVLITPSLNIIAHYGNETIDYVPVGELRGIDYFNAITTHGYVVSSDRWPERYRDSTYQQSYTYIAFSKVTWTNNQIALTQSWFQHADWPKFVLVSYGIEKTYSFLLGYNNFTSGFEGNLTRSPNFNKLYSNPDFDMYAEVENKVYT